MSEYGWSVEYTLQLPLAQGWCLYNAICLRYGGDLPGPTYLDREIIEILKPS